MYAMYKRQLSEVQPDGTKKVTEKGWFTRGTKLIINGFRRDDMFVAKKYAKTQGHTIYKITEINEEYDIIIDSIIKGFISKSYINYKEYNDKER